MARKLQYKSLDLPPTSDIINTSSMCRVPSSAITLPGNIGVVTFINSLNSRIIILGTDSTLYKYDRVENTVTTLLQTVGSYQIYSVYVIDSNIYYTTANGSSTCDVHYFNIASQENRLIGTIPRAPYDYHLLQLWNGTLYLVPKYNDVIYQVNTNTLTSIGYSGLPYSMGFLCSPGFLICTGGNTLSLVEKGWSAFNTYTLMLPSTSRSMILGADNYLYVVQSTTEPYAISLLKIELSSTPAIVDTISLTYTGGFFVVRAVRSYGKYVLVFLNSARVCIYDTTLDTSFEIDTGLVSLENVIILDNQDILILRGLYSPQFVFPNISQINDVVLRPWQSSQNFNR